MTELEEAELDYKACWTTKELASEAINQAKPHGPLKHAKEGATE